MNTWQRWAGIMKCYPFEEKRLAKWEPPYIVQPKYDGVRCRAVPLPNGSYMLLSSEENVIFSVPHINEALVYQGYYSTEFDGELYYHGMNFESIVSITSRTKNIHPEYDRIQFHIFDHICDTSQMDRTIILNTMYFENPLIKSPFWLCNSLQEIMEVYNELISLGYEGIIVRHYLAPYERKRSTMVMKFKPKKEDNYVIQGYQEEVSKDGNPKGRLGALICSSGDGNTFSVGTGYSEKMRISLWERREMLPGLVCRVKYQHITSGKQVPRFPVFVEVIK